jgi:hypothetical protein
MKYLKYASETLQKTHETLETIATHTQYLDKTLAT